ncbi:MAG TPA: alpha/beta hydrolase [Vicinamibacterales bacterium]|jgi:fermentation-respiration switch protein FrsA (DUF1100 family)|nr:alpha/beta hydrolase [Vicinamibacterales bacterium]HVZ20644.1 alpha/beta hydrolase [Vicinamibacterales bacterium]
MKRWVRRVFLAIVLLVVIAAAGLVWKARAEAHRLLTNPIATRELPHERPIDYGMVYDDVSVKTADGLKLVGWYVPTKNGALVLAQHGYKSQRGEMLDEAAMLNRHGYGVLITSVRAHDLSDGTLITFGVKEMADLDAWYRFALTEPGVDPNRIGILGNSMGGSLAIQYAAQNPKIAAVVANAAFSSLSDTVATSVKYFTGLPAFPFAPLITFWAEREGGFRASDIDATKWIGRISPRPVFLMQGGKDVVISKDSGRKLYAAAGEPKELWEDPGVGHAAFDTARPAEYERRVVGFFDRYLGPTAVAGITH